MDKMKPLAEKIQCTNGVKLSVQASSFHYSTPREDHGPYSDVEVGFIEKYRIPYGSPESWIPYGEDGTVVSDVFAYIPISLVVDFINENGGIEGSLITVDFLNSKLS